jgi:hypothetical protein
MWRCATIDRPEVREREEAAEQTDSTVTRLGSSEKSTACSLPSAPAAATLPVKWSPSGRRRINRISAVTMPVAITAICHRCVSATASLPPVTV